MEESSQLDYVIASHLFSYCFVIKDVSETFHPQGTDWYKEPFAWFLSTGIRSYESEMDLFFRHVQNVLDPLQQVVAGGSHLKRNSSLYISAAGFDGGTEINTTAMYSFPWIIRPHVYGVAYK